MAICQKQRSPRVWAKLCAHSRGEGRAIKPSLPCPQDRPDCRVPGGRLRRSVELPQPGYRAGNTAHRGCNSWREPTAGLRAYRRGPALFWLRRRLRTNRRDLFPTCPNEAVSAEQNGRGEETRPTKAPGHGRTQERYGEKRARVKRRRSVTLRVSSTNQCAAYGRTVPGALGDQPRPRSTGPSGQAVTETGISRAKVVSPKGRSAS